MRKSIKNRYSKKRKNLLKTPKKKKQNRKKTLKLKRGKRPVKSSKKLNKRLRTKKMRGGSARTVGAAAVGVASVAAGVVSAPLAAAVVGAFCLKDYLGRDQICVDVTKSFGIDGEQLSFIQLYNAKPSVSLTNQDASISTILNKDFVNKLNEDINKIIDQLKKLMSDYKKEETNDDIYDILAFFINEKIDSILSNLYVKLDEEKNETELRKSIMNEDSIYYKNAKLYATEMIEKESIIKEEEEKELHFDYETKLAGEIKKIMITGHLSDQITGVYVYESKSNEFINEKQTGNFEKIYNEITGKYVGIFKKTTDKSLYLYNQVVSIKYIKDKKHWILTCKRTFKDKTSETQQWMFKSLSGILQGEVIQLEFSSDDSWVKDIVYLSSFTTYVPVKKGQQIFEFNNQQQGNNYVVVIPDAFVENLVIVINGSKNSNINGIYEFKREVRRRVYDSTQQTSRDITIKKYKKKYIDNVFLLIYKGGLFIGTGDVGPDNYTELDESTLGNYSSLDLTYNYKGHGKIYKTVWNIKSDTMSTKSPSERTEQEWLDITLFKGDITSAHKPLEVIPSPLPHNTIDNSEKNKKYIDKYIAKALEELLARGQDIMYSINSVYPCKSSPDLTNELKEKLSEHRKKLYEELNTIGKNHLRIATNITESKLTQNLFDCIKNKFELEIVTFAEDTAFELENFFKKYEIEGSLGDKFKKYIYKLLAFLFLYAHKINPDRNIEKKIKYIDKAKANFKEFYELDNPGLTRKVTKGIVVVVNRIKEINKSLKIYRENKYNTKIKNKLNYECEQINRWKEGLGSSVYSSESIQRNFSKKQPFVRKAMVFDRNKIDKLSTSLNKKKEEIISIIDKKEEKPTESAPILVTQNNTNRKSIERSDLMKQEAELISEFYNILGDIKRLISNVSADSSLWNNELTDNAKNTKTTPQEKEENMEPVIDTQSWFRDFHYKRIDDKFKEQGKMPGVDYFINVIPDYQYPGRIQTGTIFVYVKMPDGSFRKEMLIGTPPGYRKSYITEGHDAAENDHIQSLVSRMKKK